MHTKRILADGLGIYHCMSRTVNGAAFFETREKEVFRKMLHQIADFSGVEVLTFCLMNNHFHLLVRVPPAEGVSDEELLRRYRVLYPKPTRYQTASIGMMAKELHADGSEAEAIRARLLARMGDVSAFMKTLKQRFSTWFNKTHDRFGPLWADRFKSVLVEGKGYALQTMAAYIDLNPVRAGIVQDPKDYRFCGYAEAVAGLSGAVRGLSFVTAGLYEVSAAEALKTYRMMLFGKGSAPVTGAAGAAGLDRAAAVRVLTQEHGHLPQATLLRCRIRYFTEGAVLGSRSFVAAHMDTWQRASGRKRRARPRTIQAEAAAPLVVLKNVKRPAYS
jgi:REP element-mobilizing transposase RayT